MLQATTLVCFQFLCLPLDVFNLCYAGHPLPKPEHANAKPQVGGSRNGLLPPFPRTVPEETWLRGAWPTDENGVAQFTCASLHSPLIQSLNTYHPFPAIFPGYYTGRATHVHAKVFPEWTTHENGTFSGDRLVHVGQFFFDDEINIVVDKVPIFPPFLSAMLSIGPGAVVVSRPFDLIGSLVLVTAPLFSFAYFWPSIGHFPAI